MRKNAAIAKTARRFGTPEFTRPRNACGEHLNAKLVPPNSKIGDNADARRHVKADRTRPEARSANTIETASVPAKMAIAGTPRILALDLAVHTGFADGLAGSIPESGVIRLKRPADGPEIAAFTIAAWLRERIKGNLRPDLVIVEAYLPPAGHKSADSVILQYMLHGVVQALCRCHGVRIESVSAPTIRKHFCGRAHAGERSETKLMVVRRAQALGYLPRDCNDDNQADAIAAWSYTECHFARVTPRHGSFGDIPCHQSAEPV